MPPLSSCGSLGQELSVLLFLHCSLSGAANKDRMWFMAQIPCCGINQRVTAFSPLIREIKPPGATCVSELVSQWPTPQTFRHCHFPWKPLLMVLEKETPGTRRLCSLGRQSSTGRALSLREQRGAAGPRGTEAIAALQLSPGQANCLCRTRDSTRCNLKENNTATSSRQQS